MSKQNLNPKPETLNPKPQTSEGLEILEPPREVKTIISESSGSKAAAVSDSDVELWGLGPGVKVLGFKKAFRVWDCLHP